LFFGLRRQDGSEGDPEGDKTPVRIEAPPPADRDACRTEVKALERDLALLPVAMASDTDAKFGYGEWPDNPALTAHMAPLLAGRIARTSGVTDVKVSCLVRACRFEVPVSWANLPQGWFFAMHDA